MAMGDICSYLETSNLSIAITGGIYKPRYSGIFGRRKYIQERGNFLFLASSKIIQATHRIAISEKGLA